MTLLDRMLAAASMDMKTTDAGGGAPQVPLLEGMSIRRSTPRRDERGRLTEIFDRRWDWSSDAYDYCYMSTVLPGVVKGWALHREHEDRYFVLSGEVALVTFDPREGSSTFGKICKVVLSGSEPCLINIPRCVWHADHNVGTSEAIILNFPSVPYDHENPDKFRLPLDTDLIPYDFGDARGW